MAGIRERLRSLFNIKNRAIRVQPAQSRLPYEDRAAVLNPLSLIVTIVPRHQEQFFEDTYFEAGFSLNLVSFAHSNPPQEIMQFLGLDQMKKSVLFTIGRSEYVGPVLEKATARFATSDQSRGIAFSVPVRTVAGISAYKFLADQNRAIRRGELESAKQKKPLNKKIAERLKEDLEMRNEENGEKRSVSPTQGQTAYDVIFCIVNKGYTDLVMEASRRAGARGGTIIAARGTGNPEIEQFYGFSIQPDKEVVIILVDATISDKVSQAIYDAAGLSTNGQGFMFTIPAGRVAGMTAKDISQLVGKEKKD